VDPDAVLFYWPSRLDTVQKGVELVEAVAGHFTGVHKDAQIAVVADPVGADRTHADILGRIAWSSEGRVTYQPYSEELSMLGSPPPATSSAPPSTSPAARSTRWAISSAALPRTGTPGDTTTRSGS
jgi:hypothetical protein